MCCKMRDYLCLSAVLVLSAAQALEHCKTHLKAKLKAEILLCRKRNKLFLLISPYAVMILDRIAFFSKLISNRMNYAAFLVIVGNVF